MAICAFERSEDEQQGRGAQKKRGERAGACRQGDARDGAKKEASRIMAWRVRDDAEKRGRLELTQAQHRNNMIERMWVAICRKATIGDGAQKQNR